MSSLCAENFARHSIRSGRTSAASKPNHLASSPFWVQFRATRRARFSHACCTIEACGSVPRFPGGRLTATRYRCSAPSARADSQLASASTPVSRRNAAYRVAATLAYLSLARHSSDALDAISRAPGFALSSLLSRSVHESEIARQSRACMSKRRLRLANVSTRCSRHWKFRGRSSGLWWQKNCSTTPPLHAHTRWWLGRGRGATGLNGRWPCRPQRKPDSWAVISRCQCE